ncbi:sodium:solute symporter [bacterium]|nr:sodium:solute symporter [bacterium]
MNLVTAGWVLILAYMAVVLFFVVRGAKKNSSMADYAVGSIAFSPIAVGLALAASMTSAATFIINPGFIALYGVSGVISYALALPLAAMISLVVLTKGFRKHGSSVKALSMAQWMGTRYKSKGYGLFFAFLSLLLVTFIVLIVVGLVKVLSKTLDISETWALFGVVAFIFGYMMFGGANSMVYTNTIQAVLMLIVAFILLGSGYEHFSNGVHGFLDKLRAIDPNLATATNPESFLFRDWFEIIVTQMIVGVAIVCQPHIITKSLLLKTDSDVNKYLTAGIITEMIFFSVVVVGLYARITFPEMMLEGEALKMDGVISAYVVREFPVFVGLLVVMGLLSAGISTLEGLIQSISTTITKDIVEPLFGRYLPAETDARETRLFLLNKVAIVLLAGVSIWLAHRQLVAPKLSVAIFAQNGVYAYFSAAFLPILFGMFLKGVPTIAPVAASITAIVVHFWISLGNVQIPGTLASGQNPGVASSMAIVASVVVGGALYLILRKDGGDDVPA